MTKGMVFNIQRFTLHDGPGIRTTVFMKGCPLRCLWCDNPESCKPKPELGVIKSRCDRCGDSLQKCVKVCPEKAISLSAEGTIQVQRDLCNACGECAQACSPNALTVYGRERTVEEVFEEICKDQRFYRGSGGGVTISGGEPLQQGAFALELFRACRDQDIHTCLDTCGFAAEEPLRAILPFTNYVHYDIKHLDPETHRKLTGQSNERILANLKMSVDSGAAVLVRMPFIPGLNDSAQNIENTARFIDDLGHDVAIQLLPYHRLGQPKYQALDLTYPLEGKDSCPAELVEDAKRSFESYGVRCSISR